MSFPIRNVPNINASNYTCNVLINIGGEKWQEHGLRNVLRSKSHGKDVPFYCIDRSKTGLKEELTKAEAEILAKVTNTSRIYLLDHGTPNANHIQKGGHYSRVAEWISKGLTHRSLEFAECEGRLDKQALKVSLLSCNAAVGGTDFKKSFGRAFHYELGKVFGKK
ncbi:MAG: hypothetical protein ACI9S8_002709 [Chlamydiales bacterium]|jgi:hypothetical protein